MRPSAHTGQQPAEELLPSYTVQPARPLQHAHSPVELPLERVQPALHITPRPPAGAGQRDVEEAGGGGGAARQLLVLAAPAVPPKAENVGHPREGAWSQRVGVRPGRKATPPALRAAPLAPPLPDSGLQVSLLFSLSSARGSPPSGSAGGLGLEKGTSRSGLELRPGSSSSLLSGLEGPLDGLSPQGSPGRPRLLCPAPARPGPKADISPGCSVSVGNRKDFREGRAGKRRGGRDGKRNRKELAEKGQARRCAPLSCAVYPPPLSAGLTP